MMLGVTAENSTMTGLLFSARLLSTFMASAECNSRIGFQSQSKLPETLSLRVVQNNNNSSICCTISWSIGTRDSNDPSPVGYSPIRLHESAAETARKSGQRYLFPIVQCWHMLLVAAHSAHKPVVMSAFKR